MTKTQEEEFYQKMQAYARVPSKRKPCGPSRNTHRERYFKTLDSELKLNGTYKSSGYISLN